MMMNYAKIVGDKNLEGVQLHHKEDSVNQQHIGGSLEVIQIHVYIINPLESGLDY